MTTSMDNRAYPRYTVRDEMSSLAQENDVAKPLISPTLLEDYNSSAQQERQPKFSFLCAIICCLCAGSLTTYSLYANQFMTQLHYSQLQVNGVSIAAELAMCLPVSLYGYLCDNYSPRPLALLSGVAFGSGYFLASFTYDSDQSMHKHGSANTRYYLMVVAFIAIGASTSCMYVAALTTCAKNFEGSPYRGFFLSAPLAAFGLSGLWLSQACLRICRVEVEERSANRGPLDVPLYFKGLGLLLFAAGVLGFFGLHLKPRVNCNDDQGAGETSGHEAFTESVSFSPSNRETQVDSSDISQVTSPSKDAWEYLCDRNMWLLATGFFLVSGIGEAFINNVGSILDAEYPMESAQEAASRRSSHVSILAVASTMSRILTGVFSDRFAPREGNKLGHFGARSDGRRCISRVAVLLGASSLLLLGCILLSIPRLHQHVVGQSTFDYLPFTTALVGIGYGSCFTIVPIIISVIWGVKNFGFNWGVMATLSSFGVTFWSLIYAWIYQLSSESTARNPEMEDTTCGAGWVCYGPWGVGITAGVLLAMVAWTCAWKRKNGWQQRMIAI